MYIYNGGKKAFPIYKSISVVCADMLLPLVICLYVFNELLYFYTVHSLLLI